MRKQRKALSRRDIEKIDIWEGAKALVQMDDRTAVPHLIRTLRRSGDVEKRTAAAYGLAWLKDRRGVKPLVTTLLNKKERPKVRGQAAEGLAYLFCFQPDAHVFRALTATLSDPSAEVRFWSAFALGQLRDKRAIPALKNVVENDKAILRGWWAIAKEAKDAIKQIKGTRKMTTSNRSRSHE